MGEYGICAEFVDTGRCGHSDTEHDRMGDAMTPAVPDRAAAPDALRARVEALAAEWEADDEAYLDRVGHHYAVSLGGLAAQLRALLEDGAR